MKKVLSSILISLIIFVNLFAPISVGFDGNNLEVKKNKAEALGETVAISVNPKPDGNLGININGLFKTAEKIDSGTIHYTIGTSPETYASDSIFSEKLEDSTITNTPEEGKTIYNYSFGQQLYKFSDKGVYYDVVKGNTYFARAIIIVPKGDGTNLKYESAIVSFVAGTPSTTGTAVTDEGKAAAQAAYDAIIAAGGTPEQAFVAAQGVGNEKPKDNPNANTLPACGIFGKSTIMGCVVQGFYYILFVPTSYLFALAGTMFDYTFAYSVQDSSYKSAFVVQGWGLIRDFCNMFFIFIMLYVAIGTILSLHSMKTKETIVNIVIIGLFINFSLFATQLIIDASNITARVFYNSNAITITEKDANGVTNATPGLKVGEGGIIPLSAALVNKVNPQNLIFSADKINSIQNNTGSNIAEENKSKNLGIGQFILIIIMASAVNIVGLTVFITVAFLFIARVIGLWMAMILSPLAFFTYILPEMADTKMIGWKHWWTDTLKLAFLAPVFIFFIYIILKFLQADLISDIASKSLSGDGLGYFVTILVPFAFIMILMIKAKKIAVDMSGEFGEMAVKAGSAVGGLALGAATGGAAFAMRGTIGALGDKVANNDWLKTHGGRLGNMARDAGKWTASKSFDVRSTALGGDAMKGMGVDAGKAKEGGYAKHKTEITEKRRERAESKKLGNNSEQVQKLHGAEEREANLNNDTINDTNRVKGMLTAKRTAAIDLTQKLNAADKEVEIAEKDAGTDKTKWTPAQQKDIAAKRLIADKARDDFKKNQATIDKNEAERVDINSAKGKYSHKTGNGKVNEAGYNEFKNVVANSLATKNQAIIDAKGDLVKIKEANDEYDGVQKAFKEMNEAIADKDRGFEKDITKVESLDNLTLRIVPHLHHEVEQEDAKRVNEYATNIRGRWFNKEANDIAAHEAIIKAEVKKH